MQHDKIEKQNTGSNMDMKKQINMCIFMSTKLILIQIKFDIDINNDELSETI